MVSTKSDIYAIPQPSKIKLKNRAIFYRVIRHFSRGRFLPACLLLTLATINVKASGPRFAVTVCVSPQKYPFYFYRGRLCQHSSFFEKALHGSFEDATTGSM